MKKLLSFIAITIALSIATSSSLNAQTSNYTFPVVAGDSLATADSVIKKIGFSADKNYASLGFGVSIKKGTGTLDGKLYLYTAVAGHYTLTDSSTIKTLITASGVSNDGYTNGAYIEKAHPAGTTYLIVVTQAGSLTASPVKVTVTSRRFN